MTRVARSPPSSLSRGDGGLLHVVRSGAHHSPMPSHRCTIGVIDRDKPGRVMAVPPDFSINRSPMDELVASTDPYQYARGRALASSAPLKD